MKVRLGAAPSKETPIPFDLLRRRGGKRKFLKNITNNVRVLIKDARLATDISREELSRRGSDWQYIFEMEHLQLHPTKPFLIEGRYPTVGHFEGKISSSWACEPGCYSSKLVLK